MKAREVESDSQSSSIFRDFPAQIDRFPITRLESNQRLRCHRFAAVIATEDMPYREGQIGGGGGGECGEGAESTCPVPHHLIALLARAVPIPARSIGPLILNSGRSRTEPNRTLFKRAPILDSGLWLQCAMCSAWDEEAVSEI